VSRKSRRPDRTRRESASTTRTTPTGSHARWYALILAVAVAATYANSLSGAFVLDDEATVVQNLQIRDLSRPAEVLHPAPDSPIAGRPLASLTIALNYAAGGLSPRGYHAVNILLHLACTLLLFVLVRRTIERHTANALGAIDAAQVAFGASLLWAVHPLNSEVVDYVTQRTEALMAACYLGTLYAAVRAAEAFRAGASRGRWEALAVTACAAGALSKESIATLPLVLVVYDRVFLFRSWRELVAGRRRLYAGLASTWLVIAALVATAPRTAVAGFSSGVSPWTYLLNQAPMIVHYLRLAVWPESLVAFYGWPMPVTLAEVAAPAAVVLTLILLTAVALWRSPAVGFLGTWFFITLAPASSVLPIATEVGAERRMYLPLMAVAVLAVSALWLSWHRLMRRHGEAPSPRVLMAVPLAAVVAASAVLAAVTVARNREYESPLTLARTIVERRPNAVAHHMLGEQLILAGRPEDARPHLREAVAGGNSRAGYLLAQVLAMQGKHDEAIAELEAFVRTYRPPTPLVPQWLEPPLTDVVPARFLLGRARGLRGEWGRAAEQARWILEIVPGHVGARGLLGDAMFAQEQWTDAAAHYREYLKRQPADTRALMNYGIAQVAVEQFDEAIAAFGRAAELDPANPRPKELMALAQEDRARFAAR
jgi:Flp pilus assembly protein TadD